MNGTKPAAPRRASHPVNVLSTHGFCAGAGPIDDPSCKKRKRAPNTPSPPPFSYSSRTAKSNISAGHLSISASSSSLGKPSPRKKGKITTTADVAVVTSVTAAATAAVVAVSSVAASPHRPALPVEGLEPFGYQGLGTRWVPTIQPGTLSCSEELVKPSTSLEPSAQFIPYSPLAPTQYPNAYYPSPYPLASSSPNLSPFHPQTPFPPFHQDPLPPYPWSSYSTDHSGITAHKRHGGSSSPHPLNLAQIPAMIVKKQPVPNGDGTSPGGPSPVKPDPLCLTVAIRNKRDEQLGDWCIVDAEQPGRDGDGSDYDSPREASDISSGDIPAGEGDSWESLVLPLPGDVASNGNRAKSQSERRSRRLGSEAREATGRTRKLKCKPDPENPKEEDCLTCRGVKLESKKVIHRLPCLRWKLAEIVLFRDGGLDLTKRWTGVKMKDLGPRDWDGSELRRVKITIGCPAFPLQLTVRKFHPNSLDVTWKHWVDSKGNKKRFDIQPFALADIRKTAYEYDEYVYMYARLAVREYSRNERVDTLVRETYDAALKYALRVDKYPPQLKGDDVNPAHFLNQYFRLWFAIRNTLGSAFVIGPDTLDMDPIDDTECPYHGTVSVPRMIPAQFDSLGHETILAPLRKQVLEGLWKMIASKSPYHFFTIYLTVFMFLHEVSVTSADRLRRARENKYETCRYDLAPFTERLQEGANIVLSYWHYYKRDVNPLTMDTDNRKKTIWAELSPTEIALLADTSRAYKERAAAAAERQPPEEMTWEHDLYFVSQMFDEDWQPGPTFRW
ncbi:hypothetical protein GGS23DRAFT_594776 [Durotheca rogersii]|uniref:uncharacterized protein n=1 Tax=Durotheca rogersii TaxID=419775 RepID=UPI002220934F|nr:uncharacterized protein GGS23DRAFT_594776 [Durotheca rogersii]KAI5865233.1 hypothetical protein GGS23DRAFT_594776 [Durotheca rogersii]